MITAEQVSAAVAGVIRAGTFVLPLVVEEVFVPAKDLTDLPSAGGSAVSAVIVWTDRKRDRMSRTAWGKNFTFDIGLRRRVLVTVAGERPVYPQSELNLLAQAAQQIDETLAAVGGVTIGGKNCWLVDSQIAQTYDPDKLMTAAAFQSVITVVFRVVE